MGERMGVVLRRILTAEAEAGRLRGELARFDGHEPTIAEEIADLKAENARLRIAAGIDPYADIEVPGPTNDRARRIWLDARGDAWLDVCTDETGAVHAAKIDGAGLGELPLKETAKKSGPLVLLGRTR
jgi:hypothetical protein